jgi:hypothetical protein
MASGPRRGCEWSNECTRQHSMFAVRPDAWAHRSKAPFVRFSYLEGSTD